MGQSDARILTAAPEDTPIRDAASLIVLRDRDTAPKVLMGQRGKSAVFMPSKFVFPGGAVDPSDSDVPLANDLSEACRASLNGERTSPDALVAAAIRELWEETGLLLGAPDPRAVSGDVPTPWRAFTRTGHLPGGADLRFFFRAITPPGRPRRFDARFFLADANSIRSDLDDFSGAETELSHLQWVPLEEARRFDMPFITEVILAELAADLAGTAAPGVPFFDNATEISRFRRL